MKIVPFIKIDPIQATYDSILNFYLFDPNSFQLFLSNQPFFPPMMLAFLLDILRIWSFIQYDRGRTRLFI